MSEGISEGINDFDIYNTHYDSLIKDINIFTHFNEEAKVEEKVEEDDDMLAISTHESEMAMKSSNVEDEKSKTVKVHMSEMQNVMTKLSGRIYTLNMQNNPEENQSQTKNIDVIKAKLKMIDVKVHSSDFKNYKSDTGIEITAILNAL